MPDLSSKSHASYTPSTFGWGSRDPMHDPSLLVEFVHSGVSFGSMNRDVVGVFTAVLDELVPLIPGGLVAGQCGCYNPGSVTVGGDRSFHTYAIAIDVNWGSNPMYAKAHPTGPHTLPTAASGIAQKYGCEWGGDWSYPQDWMHIECHLSPADARAFTPTKELTMDAEVKARFDAIETKLAALADLFVGHDGAPHHVEVLARVGAKGGTFKDATSEWYQAADHKPTPKKA